ncbi:MAG TPA: triphosphoribosyl-dephospho-CoA synthase [Verrucomicrobiae bacterium]|nr:triphosphoribosyl-dephospho-CoA synthase [Verrucomicrobiae bacterium]
MPRPARAAEGLTRAQIRAAYLAACRAELQALKPGNVHVFAEGHGMSVADFEASALASAGALTDPALKVGERILRAVRRSRRATGCNTNLGIVLLCAPLAAAAEGGGGADLRLRLRRVLAKLGRQDAAAVFSAIALANPGGLGESRRHDVRRPPRVTLLTAMAEARRRDRIAGQYASAYRDVFRIGLPRLGAALSRWGEGGVAVSATFLAFLSAFPDSHVRRKFGLGAARTLCRRAEGLGRRLMHEGLSAALQADLLKIDAELKAAGINPGTSADLTVATLFAAALQDALAAPQPVT